MPLPVPEVASRARTENFPVASLLFPREHRPHLSAIYGFARLVDILGDEWEGDRLAALDELEAQLDACYGAGEPEWPVMRELKPTIEACALPREPFARLIEANRMDQRITEYETWDDLREYCRHSADPVGRLVLGVIGRAEHPQLVAWSDDVCTGLQLVNFLQDVPRDLALGRVYLPAEDRRRFGVTVLGRPNEPLTHCWSSKRIERPVCWRRASRCATRSAGAPARRSGSSRAAAWRRSTRFATRNGTSSTGDRGPRA